jgi:hypothetical protein
MLTTEAMVSDTQRRQARSDRRPGKPVSLELERWTDGPLAHKEFQRRPRAILRGY